MTEITKEETACRNHASYIELICRIFKIHEASGRVSWPQKHLRKAFEFQVESTIKYQLPTRFNFYLYLVRGEAVGKFSHVGKMLSLQLKGRMALVGGGEAGSATEM